MKKINLLSKVLLLAALASLSSCLPKLHSDAIVSIDVATGAYHGDSPVDIKSTPGENVGYLLSEAVFTHVDAEGPSSNLYTPNPQNEFLAAGPSDGSGRRHTGFAMPRAAAMPTNYFTLSEELEFVGKGFKSDGGEGGSESDHLYYLEIPVLLNYNVPVAGANTFRIGLGPYAAAGLFGHYSSSFDGQSSSGSLKFGSNADFPRMDYGLVINAGYNITSKISLSLNYDWGLRNISDPDDKIYNRSFGLNLGYRIK